MAGTKKTLSTPNGTKRAPAKTLAEAKPKPLAKEVGREVKEMKVTAPTSPLATAMATRKTTARHITMPKVVRGQAGVDHQAIAQRAYELFQRRGCVHGHHEQDWLQAEYELRSAIEHRL